MKSMFENLIHHILAFAPLASIVTAIIAIRAFVIAKKQLSLAKQNTMLNIAKNEIDIFAKLDERQKTLSDYALEFEHSQEVNEEMLINQIEQAKERYYNLLDTICLYALNGNITKANFYKQYRSMFLVLEEIYSEELSSYENIKKVVLELKHV